MAHTSEPLASYLREMCAQRRHELLLGFLTYPKTDKLDQGDKPVATCTYSCSGAQCDFAEAFRCIAENVDLRAFQAEPVLKEVLKDIEAHTQDHLAHVLDGFEVYYHGFDLLRLRRLDEKGNPASGSRTGFLDYSDIRSRALEESRRKRDEKATVNIAARAVNQGCVLL